MAQNTSDDSFVSHEHHILLYGIRIIEHAQRDHGIGKGIDMRQYFIPSSSNVDVFFRDIGNKLTQMI